MPIGIIAAEERRERWRSASLSDIYAYSDQALLARIGERLRRTRLDRNWTQAAVADRAGLDRTTVGALERGDTSGPLALIALLRALGELDVLAPLLEEPRPSPLDVVREKAPRRRRASPDRGAGT